MASFFERTGRPAPGSGFEFPQSPQKYDRYSRGQPISQQISLLFSSDFPLDNAIRNRITLLIGLQSFGEVLERLNRPVSKTGVGVTPPWVRIPPSPLRFLPFSIDYNEIGACLPRCVPRNLSDGSGGPQVCRHVALKPPRFQP